MAGELENTQGQETGEVQESVTNDLETGGVEEEKEAQNQEEEQTTETQEEKQQEDETFDPDKLDFDKEEEVELDITPYESLKEKGIDITGKNFKQNVSLLQECGMTDPEQISKFIEKLNEKQKEMSKPKTAKEVNKILREKLSDDAKQNYQGIKNMLYNIFKENPEAKKIVDSQILTDPITIELINDIRKYYTGGKKVDVNNPPVQTKAKSTLTAEQAMAEYNRLMAEEKRKNNYIQPAKEKQIIKSIEAKLNPTALAGFREYF